ncbi:cation transporter (plasmid) [Skermanella mucosa]|uniref:cation diffusion facilitator family transporter n=1 Tax=Skermanella mucosa TaxID=1789672 RepID=UPI00192C6A9D|nr:cation transporter [Skermanella mucosa]UEM24635.1 cation transporter [Skermanella mucosa]
MPAADAEQKVLRRSIIVTVLIGAAGVLFGILSGSLSIIFDGMFSAVDASMTALALMVTRLIARDKSERFQLGFWHLEPMALALNGALLILLAFYAFVNAVGLLLAGGRDLSFDWAIVYAAVVAAACFAMFFAGRRANRAIGSEFVALDVKGWLMSGTITLALLVAFIAAAMLRDTRFEALAPYVDPAILAVLALIILPVPVRTVRQAISEILLAAPGNLDSSVRAVAEATVEKYGFEGYQTYVAKVGRSRFIEIHLIVPQSFRIDSVRRLDEIREEIGAAIGGSERERWLTIAFVGDRRWSI